MSTRLWSPAHGTAERSDRDLQRGCATTIHQTHPGGPLPQNARTLGSAKLVLRVRDEQNGPAF
jgi:hypothetical protein